MAQQSDKNFEKSGVEKPIRSGAKPVKKSGLQEMSDRTASERDRWAPRSGNNQGAPDPSKSVYAPPAPDKLKGAATHSDNDYARTLLASDFSHRRTKPSLMK